MSTDEPTEDKRTGTPAENNPQTDTVTCAECGRETDAPVDADAGLLCVVCYDKIQEDGEDR